MNKIALISFSLFFLSCNVQGVKKKTSDLKGTKSAQKITALTADKLEVVKTKKFKNGIVISWINSGNEEGIKKGDVILIDYKVNLENGTIVDGNHLLKKESFPFMVGFEMQTKGWDLAIENLKVGDFARIIIPANLARGEKGIKGLIPPNAKNYLTIRVLSKVKPTRIVEGSKVWLFEENKANKVLFNSSNRITFHYMISSESHPMYFNSFRNNSPFTLRMSDIGVIPGLKKALKKSKKADRMYIYIPSSQAYGTKGLTEFVGPNEAMFYNILVMDVHAN
ncbi:MAG: FKBP-type peptidyl-prolyl cis-trans isomerase [Flavobacteriia bacterium]|nr:FKBP-type peptidyl-prolyl cis-trans isomerase [Flavobacteriia bacterium]